MVISRWRDVTFHQRRSAVHCGGLPPRWPPTSEQAARCWRPWGLSAQRPEPLLRRNQHGRRHVQCRNESQAGRRSPVPRGCASARRPSDGCAGDREGADKMTGTDDWPVEFGPSGAAGSQNDTRYALFPSSRRLVNEERGMRTIHDTGEHVITGVSQQQSSDRTLKFRNCSAPCSSQISN